MTRLRNSFDVLLSRGDPVGSDTLLTRAREAVANGTVAELQPPAPGNRTRLWVAIAAALCVAIVVGIELVSRTGTAPPTDTRPIPIICRVSVADRHANVVLQAERGARASISVGAYRFRFAIVVREDLPITPKPRLHKGLYLRAHVFGPGLGSPGFGSDTGMPKKGRGASTGLMNISGGPIAYACGR
jgi:hypothetical protein